ncbi:hypothetical protein QJQ45_018344 [Haematococcus lacustris]|nr:hypothetical protein QJQ45_018344 [Haematococcus lacustris]
MAAELRRTDAKAFFANERTFLHWMSTSVTLGGIAAALSGVAGHAHRHWGEDYLEQAIVARVTALTMLGLSIVIAMWGGYNFQRRAAFLEWVQSLSSCRLEALFSRVAQAKLDGPYDSRILPTLLTVVLTIAFAVVFSGAIMRLTDPTDPSGP